MADYIAVHNGPQGTGTGDSVANGMSLQGAVNACTAAGDRALVADTGTYTIAAPVSFATAGVSTSASPKWIIGANSNGVADGTKPTIGHSGSTSFFQGLGASSYLYWVIANLNIEMSSAANVLSACTTVHIQNVHLAYSEGTEATTWRWADNSYLLHFYGCSMKNTHITRGRSYWFSATVFGVSLSDCYTENVAGFNNGNKSGVFERCVAKNCMYGFNGEQWHLESGMSLVNCLAYDCDTGAALGNASIAVGCTFADCTHGLRFQNAQWANAYAINCIIAHNSSYGIYDPGSILKSMMGMERGNIFYQNTSGDIQGMSIDPSSRNADPQFTDRANDDYSVLPSSPALQIPMPYTYTSWTRYADAGALVPQISGGGMFRRMARMIGAS